METDFTKYYPFYELAVLPQFGLRGREITWQSSRDCGPDESVHFFAASGRRFALIFEDYDGMGSNDDYITHDILQPGVEYEFVDPTSETDNPPSYYGFHLPAPSMYAANITGTFTLIEVFNR